MPVQLVVVAGVFGVLAVAVAAIAVSRMIAAASRPGVSLIGRSSAAGVSGALCALIVSNQFFDRYALTGLALMSTGVWLSTSHRSAGAVESVAEPADTHRRQYAGNEQLREPGRKR